MARQLAQSSPRRKAQNSFEVASARLAPLLVLAITDEATHRPSSNSPTASGAHPTNGRGKTEWAVIEGSERTLFNSRSTRIVRRKNMEQRRVSAHLINARCNRTGFRQSNAFAPTRI